MISWKRSFVRFSYPAPENRFDSIQVNFKEVVYQAMDYLRQNGRKKIGFIGGEDHLTRLVDGKKLPCKDIRLASYEDYCREKAMYRATVPGLGREVGAALGQNRELFMGIFNSPHIVGEALKTAVFAAALFEEFGFDVTPTSDEERFDIIPISRLPSSS